MIKRLAACIREYKKPSILAPVFVSSEVVMECIIPFIIANLVNEIKDGNTALQSTLQQNDSLEAHIAELEEQLATAEEDKKALDETVSLQSNQLRALDWLLEIENAYNTGDLDAAKDNIRSFEETGTVEFLPKEPLRTGITGDDAPSPAARYQSIVDKLFPDGVK